MFATKTLLNGVPKGIETIVYLKDNNGNILRELGTATNGVFSGYRDIDAGEYETTDYFQADGFDTLTGSAGLVFANLTAPVIYSTLKKSQSSYSVWGDNCTFNAVLNIFPNLETVEALRGLQNANIRFNDREDAFEFPELLTIGDNGLTAFFRNVTFYGSSDYSIINFPKLKNIGTYAFEVFFENIGISNEELSINFPAITSSTINTTLSFANMLVGCSNYSKIMLHFPSSLSGTLNNTILNENNVTIGDLVGTNVFYDL